MHQCTRETFSVGKSPGIVKGQAAAVGRSGSRPGGNPVSESYS